MGDSHFINLQIYKKNPKPLPFFRKNTRKNETGAGKVLKQQGYFPEYTPLKRMAPEVDSPMTKTKG